MSLSRSRVLPSFEARRAPLVPGLCALRVVHQFPHSFVSRSGRMRSGR